MTSSYEGFTGNTSPSNPPPTSWSMSCSPKRARPGTRPDDGDGPGLEHGGERRFGRGEPLLPPGPRAHFDRSRFARLRSLMISRTAWWPGIPHTPPPPCVAELAWYRPAMGER